MSQTPLPESTRPVQPELPEGWSPTRSIIAIVAGIVMNYFLTGLLGMMIARVFALQISPEQFSPDGGGAALHLPTQALVYAGIGAFMNALIAGTTTARIAMIAPLRHGIALGSLFGFFISMQLTSLRPYPLWFMIFMLLGPLCGASLGGAVVYRSQRHWLGN